MILTSEIVYPSSMENPISPGDNPVKMDNYDPNYYRNMNFNNEESNKLL